MGDFSYDNYRNSACSMGQSTILYKRPFSIATSNYQTLTGVLIYKLGQSPLGHADFSCQNGDLTKNMIVRNISVRSVMFGGLDISPIYLTHTYTQMITNGIVHLLN